MEYKLLDYKKLLDVLDEIKNNDRNVNRVIEEAPIVYTKFGFPVMHYTIGRGRKHIVVMGGTHGCELIGVDFVTKLMKSIALGEGIFANFDSSKYTIDFFPLQNPEGFVISTTAINKVIPSDVTNKELERLCHNYYLFYREDDINTKNNPFDRSLKLHQKMFSSVTFDDLSDDDYELKQHIKYLDQLYKYPSGSMVTWRSNGSGVDLNANNPDNPRISTVGEGISYDTRRYNNIINNFPSPSGVPCLSKNNFEFENENLALFNFLANLHERENFLALFTYHSTGGVIYHRPYSFPGQNYERNVYVNNVLASIYGRVTGYKTSGYTYLDNPGLGGSGDLLRSFLPGIFLIELSPMGGNPIGPYGDINNYYRTIKDNIAAFQATFLKIMEMEDLMSVNLIDEPLKKSRIRDF